MTCTLQTWSHKGYIWHHIHQRFHYTLMTIETLWEKKSHSLAGGMSSSFLQSGPFNLFLRRLYTPAYWIDFFITPCRLQTLCVQNDLIGVRNIYTRDHRQSRDPVSSWPLYIVNNVQTLTMSISLIFYTGHGEPGPQRCCCSCPFKHMPSPQRQPIKTLITNAIIKFKDRNTVDCKNALLKMGVSRLVS